MNFLFNRQISAMLIIMTFTGLACGQNAKVKTVTIINGDTTISEEVIGEKKITEFEKHITTTTDDDKNDAGKKVIRKKIIVSDDKAEKDAFAHAYSFGDDKDQDVEIITDENGNETKIIIKRKDEEKGEIKEKTGRTERSRTRNSNNEKEKMNIDIDIKNTTAKVNIEASGNEPINISILDENGKQIFYDSQKSGGKYSKDINLEKKGTYFLNIIRNKKSTTEKIIIN